MPLLATSLVATALVFGGLARHKLIFALSSVVVTAIVIALVVEPVATFSLSDLSPDYTFSDQHRRFMLTCAAAAFITSLPYRTRGWRYAWKGAS